MIVREINLQCHFKINGLITQNATSFIVAILLLYSPRGANNNEDNMTIYYDNMVPMHTQVAQGITYGYFGYSLPSLKYIYVYLCYILFINLHKHTYSIA